MIRKVIFILVCLVALSSCHWNGGKSSDSAELNIKVARYDRLLFEYVTMNNLSASHQAPDRRCVGHWRSG